MPDELSNFPYFEARFDKKQRPVDPEQTAKISHWLSDRGITDLLVLSHGWNNDIAEARTLYTRLIASVADQIEDGSGGGLPNRTLGVLGLFWPSKKFADEDLIPGGAASAGLDVEDAALQSQLDGLKGFFDADKADMDLDALADLIEDIDSDPAARDSFFRTARGLIGPEEELDEDDRQEIPDAFFTDSGDEIEEIFGELKKPDPPGVSTSTASSGAVAFSFSGFKAGARRLLNYLTYYQMKKRARRTGVKAVAPMLKELRGNHSDLRLHLIGHSFGGLLVTSAAWGGKGAEPAIPVSTLSLLQAAFSHNGFAEDFHDDEDGRYRSVLEDSRVVGPIIVTHTHNDKAVGIAYALASRFSREDAAAIGGPGDRFGGIGANGAQHTPEHVEGTLQDPGMSYEFDGGKLYNLLADDHISNHSDVHNNAVANAIVEGIASISA